MSQFILCKSTKNLKNYNFVKLIHCAENERFLRKIANELFNDEEMNDIWFMQDFDGLFTLAQRQYGIVTFEETDVYLKLSKIYDLSETIILWYGSFYQDLDIVNIKEQFLNEIQKGIYCPSGMCECYLRVIKQSE